MASSADTTALHPLDLNSQSVFLSGLGLMQCSAVTASAISRGHSASCLAELFPLQMDVSLGLVLVVMLNPNAS